MLPLGGRLRLAAKNGGVINPSEWVYSTILEGYKIPFEVVPVQTFVPQNPLAEGEAYKILKSEAEELLAKTSIAAVSHELGEFISSYFAVAKPRSPGKFRPILNLKSFNQNVKKYTFRMESLGHVRDWLKEGVYCVRIDLEDAFLHVPISKRFRKFLRFSWLGKLYEWCTLPFGLRCSPRVLTKVLKPVMAFLRSRFGIMITIYLDDMLIQAMSREQALFHGQLAALMLMVLGFSLNWKKSNFVPSQKVIHLGFELDTVAMLVSCPSSKEEDLRALCQKAKGNKSLTIHQCEQILGKMESVHPATPQSALFYRPIQKQLLGVKASWGENWRHPGQDILLSPESLFALDWWTSPDGFKAHCSSAMRELSPTIEIWTDANLERCGAHSSCGDFFQRLWSPEEIESDPHINLLGLGQQRKGC